MKKLHEIAKHRDTGKYHILTDKQRPNKFGWTEGIATCVCGVMGYFFESRHMREEWLALDQNREKICCECMEVVRAMRLSKYQERGDVHEAKVIELKRKLWNRKRKL